MKVKLKIIISVFFVSLFYAGSLYSADTGRATVYKVSMEELHFCEDSACAAYTQVCNTTKMADIGFECMNQRLLPPDGRASSDRIGFDK